MLQAQIFIDKGERKDSRLLFRYILEFLIIHKIEGATVFEGIAGFGPNQHITDPHSLFSFDEPPVLITFIDQDEKVRQVLTLLRHEMSHGLIITHQVEIW
ncbi:DUF190 domain-containing protein [Cytophagaceae bacterium DM2B3-1]|uniref:DUF190 domain-containing protein n=1 Tax=Xanthocytophaga flava TaxID=3048013 RepID=A0ABT7CTU0_9BACT|nr:DUF190 domain-containing protein [Xanthocytophaga flavus]MDJ1467970.1 DUF190 domain-containing protein [Xanthocytophaga flavus]MDJ1497096.1 DUF190 domain-containing protein [Xanthocytophaga flavus]